MRRYSEGDMKNERDVADFLEQHFSRDNSQLTLHHFGTMDPVDWWGERVEKDEEDFVTSRTCGLFEIKCRLRPEYTASRFTTVWVSLRKVMALWFASQGFGVPGHIVISWPCGTIRMIDVMDVMGAATGVEVEWRNDDRGARNDREPIIHVRISKMNLLRPAFEPAEA